MFPIAVEFFSVVAAHRSRLRYATGRIIGLGSSRQTRGRPIPSVALLADLTDNEPMKGHARREPWACARLLAASITVVVAAVISSATSVCAQEVGEARDGLAGGERVAIASDVQPGLGGGATLHYGLTESVLGQGELHHRFGLMARGGIYPLPWLGVGLNGLFRLDLTSGGPSAGSSFVALESRLTLRAAHSFGALGLGLSAGIWIPGDIRGPAVDFLGHTTIRAGKLSISLQGGYRLDRSGALIRSLPSSETYAYGNLGLTDFVSIGASDYDAVLVGLNITYTAERFELFGESSWDLLLGGPALLESPLRVEVGLRYRLSETLRLVLGAGASLSQRPTLIRGGPLLPIEPRGQLYAGFIAATRFSAPEARTRLQGRVIDEDGKPIVGARVRFERSGEPTRMTTTDDEGRFADPDAADGGYAIRAEADGYEPHEQPTRVTAEGTTTVELMLRRSLASVEEDDAGVDDTTGQAADARGSDGRRPERRRRAAGPVVVGRVMAGGSPVVGAQVRGRMGRRGRIFEATTDGEGRYELPGLRRGAARIRVDADGYRPQVQRQWVRRRGTIQVDFRLAGADSGRRSARRRAADEPVEVQDGTEPELVSGPAIAEAAVVGQGSVHGIVEAPSGPVAGARVRFRLGRVGRIYETTTNEAGHFSFEAVPTGDARVRVDSPGLRPATEAVYVSTGSMAEMRFSLQPGVLVAEIRGLVRGHGGAPVRALVRIYRRGARESDEPIEINTGEDGIFSLEVRPGPYRISVRAQGHATQRRGVRVERHGVTMVNVDLYRSRR